MKANFHEKNFALRLASKRRQTWTRNWPISWVHQQGRYSTVSVHQHSCRHVTWKHSITQFVLTCQLPHKFCWPHQTGRLFQCQNSDGKRKKNYHFPSSRLFLALKDKSFRFSSQKFYILGYETTLSWTLLAFWGGLLLPLTATFNPVP